MSAAAVSNSARPLVMSGIASGMPPVPVFVPMPAPVRLNQSSTVNVALRSWVVLPRVAYWLVPLSWRAWLVAAPPTVRLTVTVFELREPSLAR